MEKMRASQVFESFVRGDNKPLSSPLLSTIDRSPYVLRNTIPGTKPRLSTTVAAAINVYGDIFYPQERLYNSCSQVLNMLVGVKAHIVSEEEFDQLYKAMLNRIGDCQTFAVYIGASTASLEPVRKIYRDRGLVFPFGDTVDDALNFINRWYYKSKYEAAMIGVPKSMRNKYTHRLEEQDGVLQFMHWSLFRDATEALMFRLSDTTGKRTLINLSPA